ncbi:NRDE family protein [Spirosoma spitsbergense]|uniref:NRDE family protein n=1 Tax=Spirosoma spitsbergense TaxID=431554 RepID=UPI000364E82F|nr:NRDE family protein [Spirosoma spitsbergense]
MCTVTYLPLSHGGFLLTSSRDEQTARPAALFPTVRTRAKQTVYFPQDPQSTGTWIAASSQLTVCLLNGAFRAHTPQPPYRHSRGLVALSVFDYPSTADWLAGYNFANLEPFTLVIVPSKQAIRSPGKASAHPVEKCREIRWDGQLTHSRILDPQMPAIWSSATLYDNAVAARRQQWFSDWLWQQLPGGFTRQAIRDFHKQAGAGDTKNAVRMSRPNGLQTVSLTTIQHDGTQASMCYEDFLTNTVRHQPLTPAYEHDLAL